jgi:18S rRNA (guanine1575-N7)-methyltransferase
VICSYKISGRVLVSDQGASTVPSGARHALLNECFCRSSNLIPALARSISVLQWLLNAETSHPTSSPPHRLTRFFTTLYSALRNPSRAVLQFYPTSDDQVQLITSIAQKAGFGGGVVVDYPNSNRARKVFLCLFVGDSGGGGAQISKGLEGDGSVESEDVRAKFEKRRQRESRRERNGKQKVIKEGRDWILRKKEVRGPIKLSASSPISPNTCTLQLYRRRGKEDVPRDSKYTGRKRRAMF